MMQSSSGRQYSWFDTFLIKVNNGLDSVCAHSSRSNRPTPAANIEEHPLSTMERKLSSGLMRVNHTGEVCAQALYLGQSLTARSLSLCDTLKKAAQEEIDHLAWCEKRLTELNSHTSYLNPLWFMGSFAIGSFAGMIGDKWSLGFLAETENQVVNHLESHLNKLPSQDKKSRAIIETMQAEEKQHATTAIDLGGATLPFPIKITMRLSAKVMTTVAYFL